MESSIKSLPFPVDGQHLAREINKAGIPICIFNACKSSSQSATTFTTSLACSLAKAGIPFVLGMRHNISAIAAKIFMLAFYESLCSGLSVQAAVTAGRQALYKDKNREAALYYTVSLEDWLLPISWQNSPMVFQLPVIAPPVSITATITSLSSVSRSITTSSFFGRETDILLLERKLLEKNMLLLKGAPGIGKTSLLHFSATWWEKTGFVTNTFYYSFRSSTCTIEQTLMHWGQQFLPIPSCDDPDPTSRKRFVEAIITSLNTSRSLILIDDTELLEGHVNHLTSVQQTEQLALKQFLLALKGGPSLVIIASRTNVTWLKNATLDNNVHQLAGLGYEASTNFAASILKSIQVDPAEKMQNESFEQFLWLLDGNPILMNAFIPSLQHGHPATILSLYRRGILGTTYTNISSHPQPILESMEHSYNMLSESVKKLTILLAPFHSTVLIGTLHIERYFEEIRKRMPGEDFPFDKMTTASGMPVCPVARFFACRQPFPLPVALF